MRGRGVEGIGEGKKGIVGEGDIHQACKRPGMNPSMQRQMLIRESAEQIPHLTQTAMGGKRMAIRPRKMSVEHILLV
jgi:hypothetical protein